MNINLLELAQNYFLGSTVHQVSAAFGEPEDRLSAALRSVVPLVLGGLLARAQEPGGAAELTTQAQQVHEQGLLSDLSGLLTGLRAAPAAAASPAGGLSSHGADMMHALLGNNYQPAIAGISQQAGIQETTVSNLFSVAVAAVLGLLGRHIAQHNLDANNVSRCLSGQRDYVLGALATLPGGLGQGVASLVAGASPTEVALPALALSPDRASPIPMKVVEAATQSDQPVAPLATKVATVQPVAQAALPRPASRPAVPPVAPAAPNASVSAVSRRWPWLLLLALALAALGYALLVRRPQTTVSKPVHTQPAVPARPAPSPARVAAPAGHYEAATGTYRYDSGASTTLSLPTGTTLRVGRRSAEAQLWQLLTDSTQSLTTDKILGGIPLDQVYFETGKATLTPSSRAQLTNLAALLAAFPRAALKFGGFTDNQGPAEANLLLSADRANAVRHALITRGVAPTRVAAQGYGQTHPIASNDTPAGQAQNRRVAVLLTKK